MAAALPYLQVALGAGIVGYACVLLAQRVRAVASRGRERAPVNDLRLVIDLAARLRDAGKGDAVRVCQNLIDELLKPGDKA